jgi:hypothetical protein
MSSLVWFFTLLGFALTLIFWALDRLGKKVPRRLSRALLLVGVGCLVGAPLVSLSIAAYQWWFVPATYIYYMPGLGLDENSAEAPREFVARRVFVMQQVGPGVLHNVQITLQDDHAMGQVSSDHTEVYSEIDPGESNLSGVQPKHFWFKPSTPWNEDYTITMKSREESLFEHILVAGFPAPGAQSDASVNLAAPRASPGAWTGEVDPAMGRVEFAVRVTADGSGHPLFTCEDADLRHTPESSDWLDDAPRPCAGYRSGWANFEPALDPQPFVVTFPSGMLDMTPPLPSLLTSHPEEQASTRRLTGWQRRQMETRLREFAGNKVFILVAGGSETWRYAGDFADVFQESRWVVKGPMAGPRLKCVPTDVDLWTWKQDFRNDRPRVLAVHEALEAAGVKGGHYFKCVLTSPNALVLWVGVRSPEGINDQMPACLPAISPEVDKLVSRF